MYIAGTLHNGFGVAHSAKVKAFHRTFCPFFADVTNSVVTFAFDNDTMTVSLGGETKMKFGEKIKKLRTENNMTQEELADKLFVTRTAVSKWETDKGLPGIDSLKLIAELFDVSIDELVSDDDIQTQRVLNEKQSKTIYFVAIGFLALTVLFTLLFYFLQNIYFVIGSTAGVVGYVVFALLSKPRDKRLSAKKVILPYIIARLILLTVIVITIITTIIKLG